MLIDLTFYRIVSKTAIVCLMSITALHNTSVDGLPLARTTAHHLAVLQGNETDPAVLQVFDSARKVAQFMADVSTSVMKACKNHHCNYASDQVSEKYDHRRFCSSVADIRQKIKELW